MSSSKLRLWCSRPHWSVGVAWGTGAACSHRVGRWWGSPALSNPRRDRSSLTSRIIGTSGGSPSAGGLLVVMGAARRGASAAERRRPRRLVTSTCAVRCEWFSGFVMRASASSTAGEAPAGARSSSTAIGLAGTVAALFGQRIDLAIADRPIALGSRRWTQHRQRRVAGYVRPSDAGVGAGRPSRDARGHPCHLRHLERRRERARSRSRTTWSAELGHVGHAGTSGAATGRGRRRSRNARSAREGCRREGNAARQRSTADYRIVGVTLFPEGDFAHDGAWRSPRAVPIVS